ncbi:MAG: class I SAM-dependent methyltransferase [Acidimicrobiales bacterium]
MSKDRTVARRLAAEAIAVGAPLDWFERLYAGAQAGRWEVPWADLTPNRRLLSWAGESDLDGRGDRALVVGCGLGDDAEALAALGFTVTAFDVAPSAVRRCRQRFPDSPVDYVAADLLHLPAEWAARFSLVFEANTLQVLPAGPWRDGGRAALAPLVSPGGRLVVIARARDEDDDIGTMPWPLTRREVLACAGDDPHPVLVNDTLVEFVDEEDPPVRRFLAVFRRPD